MVLAVSLLVFALDNGEGLHDVVHVGRVALERGVSAQRAALLTRYSLFVTRYFPGKRTFTLTPLSFAGVPHPLFYFNCCLMLTNH